MGANDEGSGLDLLAKVMLVQSDLPPPLELTLYIDGDKVTRQVTLDLCSGAFPSEAARTARWQQGAVDADGALLVSNENVLYRSSEKASQAFDEIRHAVESCPMGRFLEPAVHGAPLLNYSLMQIITDDRLGEVAPDHVAVEWMASDGNGESRTGVAIYQRRGRVMAAIYGTDLTTVKPYLGIVADRLAALTAAEAGD